MRFCTLSPWQPAAPAYSLRSFIVLFCAKVDLQADEEGQGAAISQQATHVPGTWHMALGRTEWAVFRWQWERDVDVDAFCSSF